MANKITTKIRELSDAVSEAYHNLSWKVATPLLAILDNVTDSTSVIHRYDHKIVYANAAFLKNAGMKIDEVSGRRCYEVTRNRDSPCAAPDDICPLEKLLETGKPSSAEHVHYAKDGTLQYVEVRTLPIMDSKGDFRYVIYISRDITEHKKYEQQLIEQANLDNLTHLYSRSFYERNIKTIVQTAKQNNENLGILYIDLDGMKFLNDNHGHQRGDKILYDFARTLNSVIKSDDYPIRLGGDEFMVLLSNADETTGTQVINRLSDAINIYNQFNNRDIRYCVRFSAGYSMMPSDSTEDISSFVRDADARMYRVKTEVKNGIASFIDGTGI